MKIAFVALAVCLVSAVNLSAQAPCQFTTTAADVTETCGKVGIGTASPAHRLTVSGGHIAVDNGFQLIGRNAANTFYFRLIGNDSSNRILFGDPTGGIANEVRFHTNAGATPTMVITTAGFVGIGTTAPAARLQVEDLNNNTDMLLSAGDFPGSPNSPTFSLMRKDGNHVQLAEYGLKLDAADGNKFKLLYGGSGAFTATPLVVDTSGNVGIGTTNPGAAFRLDVTGAGHFTGDVTVDGVIYAKYQDVAEWVPSESEMTAGTVVVLNRLKTNAVTASTKAYDTAVAGVVSDQPGVLLGVGGENKAKIATTGRVKVRVDARTRAIHTGDLLVTSDIPGTAMLSEPLDLGGVKIHRPGTLIGKALEPLPSGEGEILVLLSLQ